MSHSPFLFYVLNDLEGGGVDDILQHGFNPFQRNL